MGKFRKLAFRLHSTIRFSIDDNVNSKHLVRKLYRQNLPNHPHFKISSFPVSFNE